MPPPWTFNGFSWIGGRYRHDIHPYGAPIPPAFSMLGIGGPNLIYKNNAAHSLHFKEGAIYNLNHLQATP